jgi:hypothetical protein
MALGNQDGTARRTLIAGDPKHFQRTHKIEFLDVVENENTYSEQETLLNRNRTPDPSGCTITRSTRCPNLAAPPRYNSLPVEES